MAGMILAGNSYLNRKAADGSATGYLGPMNAKKLAITPKGVTTKNRVSKMRDNYGEVLQSVSLPNGSDTFELVIDEAEREHIAMALMGSAAALAVSAGTVTDEPLTAIHDSWVPLAKGNLTAESDVITSDDGLTTYVRGTDYLIDTVAGLVKVLSSGNVADGASLLADYGHGAVSGGEVVAGNGQPFTAALLFDGKDIYTGKRVVLRIPEAVVSPTGSLDLLADDWLPLTLKGEIVGTFSIEHHD